MPSPTIVPCIWLDDQAEEAAAFYVGALGGTVADIARYPRSFDNPSGKPRGSVMTVDFEVAGQRFTALNGGSLFTPNPTVSFFVHATTADEATARYQALADGGAALMPLGTYPWSERYGWVRDRFGVSWQVITLPRAAGAPVIAPCLMFNGPRHAQAEAALAAYAAIFGGRVTQLERYAAGEGAPGTVKHGRVALGGQELIAMDSHVNHGAAFNEALSLQVMVEDQAELDRYWDALGAGGEPGPCGWLKDRFGVSWQLTPTAFHRQLRAADDAGFERAFQAMLGMGKLDLAALDRAFAGR